VSGLRELVWGELDEAGLLLADDKYERLRIGALSAGERWLRAEARDGELTIALAALGVTPRAAARIYGYGWQQTLGLVALLHARASERLAAARLGGLFNLGVSLLDLVCDEQPERRARLLDCVTPHFLERQLSGHGAARRSSGDPAIDYLVALIVDLFADARRLASNSSDWSAFSRLIGAMYGGERLAIAARRGEHAPTPEVWEALRRKSALPLETMATLAVLASPHATASRRDTALEAAALAGEAIWIIDDLVDVREDWNAGCWSRPLWLLAQTTGTGSTPANAEQALDRLLAGGVAAAEARCLADRLRRLRDLSGAPERALLRPIQVAVRAWAELLPRHNEVGLH
jgi:hypothetical protein